MTTIIEHPLQAHYALPHFVSVIGEEDWTPERIELTLRRGHFYALGPKDMPAKYLIGFEEGGILPSGPGEIVGEALLVPIPNTNDDFVSLLVRTTAELPGLGLFFREPYLKSTDKSEYIEGLRQIESRLYQLIEPCDVNKGSVSDAVGDRSCVWSFLMIATSPLGEPLSFSSLMTHAEMIAVTAYDGESYLLWKKRQA